MSARTLLLITQDRDLRADVACWDIDLPMDRADTIAGARKFLADAVLSGDGEYGLIAYGPDVLAGMRREDRLPREVWPQQVALFGGRAPRLLRVSAALLGFRLLSLPRDFEALFELVKVGAGAGKGEAA
jgi:hypothetical protein